ncbi:MAG: LPS-assembly protein LptD, partial [Treponema sp.]|nr:LPS-assembly protein LptD [Treponema sp.]
VVQDGGNYTPFFPSYDGSSDWNNSNLFSLEVPFRYRFNTNSSIRGKYGSLTWALPYYSDPLMDSDFLTRAEEMDWVNMLQKGAALDQEVSAQNQLGSYAWQLTGQLTPKFPNMSPYINSITINTLTSTMSFRTVDTRSSYPQNDIKRYSPSSFFYAPDSATLYSLSGSMSGTPLSLGGTAAGKPAVNTQADTPDPLINIGVPRSPFEDKEKEEQKKKDQADKLVPPELNQRFELPKVGTNRFSVDYRLAPSSSSTLKFDHSKWKEYGDIDWGDVSTVTSNFGGDASTTLNFNHTENFYTNTFSYTGNGTWRQYSYLNEEAQDFLDSKGEKDPARVNNAKEQEYKSSFFSTSYNLTSTLRPLYFNPIFGSSSLQYSLRGIAVKSNFKGTADDPEWEMIYGEWKKEKVDTHQFTTNFSALLMDKTQTLSLTSDLPPRDPSLSWRTGIRIWITETDANMRILFPGEEDKRKLEPFYLTERINFAPYGTFSQSIVLDSEKYGEVTTLTSSLNLSKWGVTASYAASRMKGYEYIPPGSGPSTTGWVQKTGEEKLQSKDFTLGFSKTMSMKELWNNRMQFSLNTSSRLSLDLQRYTSSSFTFSLRYTMGISKFLDLTLSTNSENSSIYRYLRNWPFFDDAPIEIPEGPQNNLFLDLINSFRFDDEELRKLSGFKMKNFSISATHYLGDWRAVLNWTMSPYRPPNSRQFEINNEVTFLIQWIPITELMSDVSFNKRNSPEWRVKGFGN